MSAQTRYQCGEGQCCSFSIKLEFTSTGRHQTRAVHHSVTTSDWLAQAQAAVEQPDSSVSDLGPKKSFNSWDKTNCNLRLHRRDFIKGYFMTLVKN
ncbi:hypothetical protein Bca52824_066352 [Brassica carinata]|uniref:Uncharacterized protein n=1 Tax=Brassica carinata TaxID=52824 RepID=A0A8X7QLQ8_BRACI|nr:hypothetical protein Bca52824_066352 [Brassica carinata]